jgi:hypothetical protein
MNQSPLDQGCDNLASVCVQKFYNLADRLALISEEIADGNLSFGGWLKRQRIVRNGELAPGQAKTIARMIYRINNF